MAYLDEAWIPSNGDDRRLFVVRSVRVNEDGTGIELEITARDRSQEGVFRATLTALTSDPSSMVVWTTQSATRYAAFVACMAGFVTFDLACTVWDDWIESENEAPHLSGRARFDDVLRRLERHKGHLSRSLVMAYLHCHHLLP